MSEAIPFAENGDEYKEAIETIYAKCSITKNERFKHIIERYTRIISSKIEKNKSCQYTIHQSIK